MRVKFNTWFKLLGINISRSTSWSRAKPSPPRRLHTCRTGLICFTTISLIVVLAHADKHRPVSSTWNFFWLQTQIFTLQSITKALHPNKESNPGPIRGRYNTLPRRLTIKAVTLVNIKYHTKWSYIIPYNKFNSNTNPNPNPNPNHNPS